MKERIEEEWKKSATREKEGEETGKEEVEKKMGNNFTNHK